jgi:hypothetical protein
MSTEKIQDPNVTTVTDTAIPAGVADKPNAAPVALEGLLKHIRPASDLLLLD